MNRAVRYFTLFAFGVGIGHMFSSAVSHSHPMSGLCAVIQLVAAVLYIFCRPNNI